MTFFRYLRNGFGLSKSFYFTFDVTLKSFLLSVFWGAALLAALTGLCLYVIDVVDSRNEVEQARQAAYVRELEKVVATCTSRGDNPINIGGELHFCGAHNTGVKL